MCPLVTCYRRHFLCLHKLMESLKVNTNENIETAAERLAEILVQAIDEKYVKRRKKAK